MPWSLIYFAGDDTSFGIGGYAAYDAFGVRFGRVSGLVLDEDQRVRMLKVTLTEAPDTLEYLVPVGGIRRIDASRASIELRDIKKDTIARRCFRYEGELPERRLLLSLQRHFPPPSDGIVEQLHRAAKVPGPASQAPNWTPLNELPSP